MFEQSPLPNQSTESKEKFLSKAKRLFTIWAFSAMASFGTAQAQNHSNESDASKQLKEKTWQTKKVSPSPEMKRNIEDQRDWLLVYMHSEKYKERMTKEYARYKELGWGYREMMNADSAFTAQLNKTVTKYDIKGSSLHISTISEVFPDPDITKLDSSDLEEINDNIKSRIENIKEGSWEIVDSIPSDEGEILGYTDPVTGDVRITENLNEEDKETPLHEFTHQSTHGNRLMDDVTKKILNHYAITKSDYLKDPTEILARMNVLRYMMKKYSNYDASIQDFTKEDYERAINNKEVMKNDNVKELLKILKEDELIWLMNNVADANNGKTALLSIA
jgi:hypothetical protein